MDSLLNKIQCFFYSLGTDKEFCIWDRIGNLIQDIRSKLLGWE